MDNVFTMFFISLVFLIMGSVASFLGWKAWKLNKEAAKWPTIEGSILSSVLESYLSRDDDGDTTTMYRPKIIYQYVVDNEYFTSDRVSAVGFSSSSIRRSQEKKRAAYPVGAKVLVHYDPSDPSNALLEVKPGKLNLSMVLGFLLLLTFLYFAVRMAMAIVL